MSMITWIRTSKLSIKNYNSLQVTGALIPAVDGKNQPIVDSAMRRTVMSRKVRECVRQRPRDRDRAIETARQRQRDRDRETDRHSQRYTAKKTQRQRNKGREIDTERQTQIDRGREKDEERKPIVDVWAEWLGLVFRCYQTVTPNS
jgi:hypothetical protein